MARNYKKEYAARREYLKAYRKKNKDKEVDHVDNNANNNNRSNLKCVSRKKNRAKGARKTNSKR
jgi:hypothetical protein